MKNGRQFQESIRKMYCMEVEDFIEIYGKEFGTSLWEKFIHRFDRDLVDLICYLDFNNIEKLFVYLENYLKEEGI